jgi:hypothetical protein
MLKWSKRAAVRAFRAGRILDEGHQRVKASGRPLMDFYVWAEGLGYSSYQIVAVHRVGLLFAIHDIILLP